MSKDEYVGPDTIIVPIRDLPPICEIDGKFYGNCEHHPMFVSPQTITKNELKKLYPRTDSSWDKEAIRKVKELK